MSDLLLEQAVYTRTDAGESQLQARSPGFADAWLDDYSSLLGITESRRLVGDYVLTKEDGDRRFDDAIARTGHLAWGSIDQLMSS